MHSSSIDSAKRRYHQIHRRQSPSSSDDFISTSSVFHQLPPRSMRLSTTADLESSRERSTNYWRITVTDSVGPGTGSTSFALPKHMALKQTVNVPMPGAIETMSSNRLIRTN